MSDSDKIENHSSGTSDSVEQVANPAHLPAHQQDWLLSNLISLSNSFGFELGITLNIGGVVITGTMISGKKYFEEMAKSISTEKKEESDDTPSMEEVMVEFFRGWIPIFDKQEEAKDSPFERSPRYIHLRNAQTLLGGGTIVPSKGGVLWRGRASEVDGFTFGQLNFG